MRAGGKAPRTVDEYLAAAPPAARRKLQRLRALVRAEAPEAVEKLAYGLVGFHLGGPLVYFGAFERHIGFYALPSGTAAFRAELAPYRSGKGSVQFPLPGDPPWALVRAMVRFRVEENRVRAGGGKAKPARRAASAQRQARPVRTVSRRAARAPAPATPRL